MACLLGLLLLQPTRGVAGVSSRLIYGRPPDVRDCPDEAALRRAVAERLGYDPFVAQARTTVVAEVFRDGGILKARAHWMGEDGITRGSRELVSDGNDCKELVSALALAVSIALDPIASTGAPPPSPEVAVPVDAGSAPGSDDVDPAPTPISVTPVAHESRSAAADAPPPRRRDAPQHAWGLAVGARGFVQTGLLPAAGAGIAAFARFRSAGFWSLALEGQADLPASRNATDGPGRVEAWSLTASLIPCAHYSVAGLCALGTIGQILSEGSGVTAPRSDSAFYASLGLRALLGWELGQAIGVELHTDLIAPVGRTELTLNSRDVWQAPAVGGAFGAGLRARVW